MARINGIVARIRTFEWVLVEALQTFAARARNFAAVLIASALLSSVAAA
jgi:hypothetical protein